MKSKSGSLDTVAKGVICVFLGLVAFVFSQSIFNLFFVPVIVAIVWDHSDKVKGLEERVSKVEGRQPPVSSGSSS